MSQRLRISELADIFGADSSGTHEDVNKKGAEDEDLADQEETDDETETDADEDSEDDLDTLKQKLQAAEAERDREHRRMRRADSAKAKAEADLKALREGGAKELAEAQARVKELEEQIAALQGTDTKAIIREAFRDDTSVAWHNPKLAFDLLDLNEVDVDDKGRVDPASLKDAVEKLTKEHPYLIKKADKPADDEDEDETEDKTSRLPSGARSSGSRKQRENSRTATIAQRYNIANRIPIS